MIDENFTEFLDDELGRIMPEQQAKYRKLFKEFGFTVENVVKAVKDVMK